MPIVIREHALLKDFEKLLPKKFHGCRTPKLSSNDCVTLVTFPGSVVHSRSLLHTFKKIDSPTEQIVMYAEDFTQESLEIMREKGVFFDTLKDYEWTDESHKNFMVRSGSAVKQKLITKKIRSRNPH